MIPKRVSVIRLFNKDFIKDPKLPEIDSNEWIPIEKNTPDCNICYVKNSRRVFKAIYLNQYILSVPSKWVDCERDEFINKSEITHWMAK